MRRLVGCRLGPLEVEHCYADLAGRRSDGRPYVVVNMVASADGAISVEGRTEAMSSEADRFVFHYLRSLADVILVGAQTVRAERYGPPRIPAERQAERAARGQEPVPRIAVVSGSLDLDWSSRLFSASPTRPLVLVPDAADPERRRAAESVADVVVAGDARVDMGRALAALGRRGAGLVLCEGGPTLNGELAAADAVDELCLTVAPALVGGDVGTGLLGHVHLPDLVPMTLVHALEEDGDLFLRYRRIPVGQRTERAVVAATEPGRSAGAATAFHEIMGDVDSPMVIVTASDGARRAGCLVGFASQCSIDPPRYLVCLSKKNHTYRVARSSEVLVVHFPDGDQRALAELFGEETGDDIDKFALAAWRPGPGGAPVLDDVQRWFAGRLAQTLDVGDHVAFVLEPLDGDAGPWPGQLGFQDVKGLDAGHDA